MREIVTHLNPRQRRTALTLLELMVVLVILAVVATVAMQTLQPRVDSERFQSAARLLEQVRVSTLGPTQKYNVDGTPLISGFVADMGRLPEEDLTPIATDATSSTILLPEATVSNSFSELFSDQTKLATMFPFRFRSGPPLPIDYSKIELPCGWRGPYLQLPIGAKTLKDPWGQALTPVLSENGKIISVQIQVPASAINSDGQVLTTSLSSGIVQVTGKVIVDRPEESSIRVALLTPSPKRSLTQLVALDDENQKPDSFTFSQVPIGLRAIVADVNGQRHIKYVQVSQSGINVVFDLTRRGN